MRDGTLPGVYMNTLGLKRCTYYRVGVRLYRIYLRSREPKIPKNEEEDTRMEKFDLVAALRPCTAISVTLRDEYINC